MTNYNHLIKEQRDLIQYLMDKNNNFSYIASSLKVDRTTISKEIRRNRYVKYLHYLPFNEHGIRKAIYSCDILSKPPYVCNSCSNKSTCTKPKLYYSSKIAQENYNKNLVNSRTGFDIKPEQVDFIESTIIPLIKNQKHSINQIYINHKNILTFSKSTCYKYIHEGVFSICDLDLPRKVKYKSRKQNKEDKRRNREILNGRRYEDYLEFIKNNPKFSIIQMDTVIGKSNDHKCLLTLHIPKTSFMLIRLIDKKNMEGINLKIEEIKTLLTIDNYKNIFRIILTDNGSEFFGTDTYEIDISTGEKITNLFYCDPYCSWQKAEIEKNHHHIREVIPKGMSMSSFTQDEIKLLQDHINCIPRDILGGNTPYEKTKELFPEIVDLLDCKYIEPDKVNRSHLFIKYNEKEE